MQNTIAQELSGSFGDTRQREALRRMLSAIADRLASCNSKAGGLAIKAGGGVLAKTVNAITYVAGGKHVPLAAGDMPALTGLSIGAGKYNVAVFYGDNAGALTVGFGTEGATAAAVKFPTPPEGKAILGYLLITYASAFTGNTTPLDTATTVYVDVVGPFDPSINLS